MTKQEFNRDYWCIISTGNFRKPIGYPTLKCMLGVKFDQIMSKLAASLADSVSFRPNHGVCYTFYRH